MTVMVTQEELAELVYGGDEPRCEVVWGEEEEQCVRSAAWVGSLVQAQAVRLSGLHVELPDTLVCEECRGVLVRALPRAFEWRPL